MNFEVITTQAYFSRRIAASVAIAVVLLILIFALGALSPTSALLAQESETDDPPVNFRVTGVYTTSVGVAWEVPRNRGITNYVLAKYDHNGTEFVWSDNISDTTSGGASWAWGYITLTPDTRYKFVLYLRDAQNTIVIEKSLTVRTLTAGGSSTVSNDAALSGLTLSGIDFGLVQFQSLRTTRPRLATA